MTRTSPGGGGSGATQVSALAPFSADWIGGDIRGLSAAAGTLYGYVPELSSATSTLDGEVNGLTGACRWTGTAAAAFTRAYDEDTQAARGLATLIEDTGEIIDGLAVALSRIEHDLEQAAAKARQHGAPVGTDGRPPEVCLGGTGRAAQEAGLWLEWYQKEYAACLAAAQTARARAAADLDRLTVLRPGKTPASGPGWEQALLALAGHSDTIASAEQAALTGIGRASSEAGRLMRAGGPGSADAMTFLRNNPVWQELGELGRSDATKLAGDYLTGAGAVLTGIGVYQQTHNPVRAAAEAGTDTALSAVATSAGWKAGMSYGADAGELVGSLIEPGGGTLVGAGLGGAIGAGVGWGLGKLADPLFNEIFG